MLLNSTLFHRFLLARYRSNPLSLGCFVGEQLLPLQAKMIMAITNHFKATTITKSTATWWRRIWILTPRLEPYNITSQGLGKEDVQQKTSRLVDWRLTTRLRMAIYKCQTRSIHSALRTSTSTLSAPLTLSSSRTTTTECSLTSASAAQTAAWAWLQPAIASLSIATLATHKSSASQMSSKATNRTCFRWSSLVNTKLIGFEHWLNLSYKILQSRTFKNHRLLRPKVTKLEHTAYTPDAVKPEYDVWCF